MKALSLLQPWASLSALGHKRIETRSWNTKYRGPLLIHAGLGKQYRKLTDDDPLFSFYYRLSVHDDIPTINHLPFGAIIGMVNLEGCQPVELIEGVAQGEWWLFGKRMNWEQEKAFGDYSAGRYGWLLSNPIVFPKPIPCKGRLGLWTPGDEIMNEVKTQLAILHYD